MFLDSTRVANWFSTDDPLFVAGNKTSKQYYQYAQTFWTSSEPAGVLACSLRVSICNGAVRNATKPEECADLYPYRPYVDQLSSITRLWADRRERNQIAGLIQALANNRALGPGDFLTKKGLPSLLARESLIYEGQQVARLPADQWQKEVEHLFQANLATLQFNILDHARADVTGDFLASEFCGSLIECERLCHAQVRSSRRDASRR